ncbi:single-stranded DNA-binding protein [Altererythrobacter sp. SALINAS58]|uniref:ERF family protein n=1 Tax=Alteripontixanthobacter muriae TaxID=2705546 RepID=UPI001576FC3A|nr:ERF family protein [Alteripontixanthobacter muriae]NTZ42130.1 single-stranded DNA-binding protein [Alteripontixanthobacter muriae]
MIPRVYCAINAVAAALARDGIPKERLNTRDDYLYRSIDDVLNRLAPLLAEHRLCILPRVLDREAVDRLSEDNEMLINVSVRVAFDLVSAEDGSVHTLEAVGEALDAGDKGTAKAMQSAYKYAVLQAFCVPVPAAEDADARSHRLKALSLPTEPELGWPQWAQGFEEAIRACSALDDLSHLQDENRPSLSSLSREQPQLYRRVGEAIATRKRELARPVSAITPARRGDRASSGTKAKASAKRGRSSSAAKLKGSTAHV